MFIVCVGGKFFAVINSRSELVLIFWKVVFFLAIAHALVTFPVAEFRSSSEFSIFFDALGVFCIAGPAAVKHVQFKPLTLVLRILFEHNC